MTYSDGSYYEGYWQKNEWHGRGKYIDKFGKIVRRWGVKGLECRDLYGNGLFKYRYFDS